MQISSEYFDMASSTLPAK